MRFFKKIRKAVPLEISAFEAFELQIENRPKGQYSRGYQLDLIQILHKIKPVRKKYFQG